MADPLTKADQKRVAREAKQKNKAEQRKNEEHFDYEEFNVKKKAQSQEHFNQIKQQSQAQKEAERQAQREKQIQLKKAEEAGPVLKLSRPEPELSPFACFKNDHEKWDPEKLKEEWAKLSLEAKEVYKENAKKDKERYKTEMAEWQKNQDLKKTQTSGKKGRQGL